MATFMLQHTHRAEDCGHLFPSSQSYDPSLKGKPFFCTCPSGDHGCFFQVEAAGAEEALALLPEAIRSTTRVFSGEVMTIT